MENLTQEKAKLMKVAFVLIIIVCAFFAVKIIAEVKGLQFIGGGIPASSVISFDGKGEVSAKPDLATISFSIIDNEKDVKTAQDKVTAKESAAISFLAASGIDKKDIKTEAYNSYPKYDYQNSICPPVPMMMIKTTDVSGGSAASPYYCPPGKQVLTGYEVSENISVKVRDLAKAGDIIKGLGGIGISNISGPNFSIENEEGLKAEARKMAIDEAKKKAEVLVRDLGVHLVRIVNFSENGNNPMYYAVEMMAKDSIASSQVAPSPELPTGENKITSNVSITYEIR
ncbi:MAG TPA: SIMPL domain-containing protein [Candidatus Paceibacterota bacterium]|jgi:uncharacterized protein YggE|nr:SIMPL domain-containing protein [Candidatus Paceibacterota bacterium]